MNIEANMMNKQSSITDEEIRKLRVCAERCPFTEAGSISQLCACSFDLLSPEVPGYKPKDLARERCSEIFEELTRRGVLNDHGKRAKP